MVLYVCIVLWLNKKLKYAVSFRKFAFLVTT